MLTQAKTVVDLITYLWKYRRLSKASRKDMKKTQERYLDVTTREQRTTERKRVGKRYANHAKYKIRPRNTTCLLLETLGYLAGLISGPTTFE